MLLYQPGQISKIYVGEQRTIGDRDSLKHLERLLRLQDQETRRLKNTKKTVETRNNQCHVRITSWTVSRPACIWDPLTLGASKFSVIPIFRFPWPSLKASPDPQPTLRLKQLGSIRVGREAKANCGQSRISGKDNLNQHSLYVFFSCLEKWKVFAWVSALRLWTL